MAMLAASVGWRGARRGRRLASWARGAMLVALVASAAVPVLAPPAAAVDAVLRLRDGGGFEIAGNVTGFDGTSYVMETRAFGRLKIEAARYDCIGPGCGSAKPAPTPQQSALIVDPRRAAGTDRDFTIEGSDAVSLSLLPDLIRGYAASIGAASAQLVGADPKHMRFRITSPAAGGRAGEVSMIDVRLSDSGSALDALANRRAVIAVTSRPMSDSEKAALERASARLRDKPNEHVVGLDGLAVIVAPGNPVRTLKLDDVRRIFTGEVDDWSRLGLPAGPIHLYASTERGGAVERLSEIALGRGSALPQSTIRLPGEAQVSDAVARDANGIAVTSLAFVRSARGVDIANSCGLVWRPSSFAVKSEEYPLSRRLYLYTGAEAGSELAQGLVAFAATTEGQATVRDAQLVDQRFEWRPYAEELPRIAADLSQPKLTDAARRLIEAAQGTLAKAHRLSSTFRFARNSAQLDAKARADLERLARFVTEPAMAGRRLLLVGFTDSDGDFEHNVDLSERRAASVYEALEGKTSAGVVSIATRGYGPVAPVACNVDDRDKFLNRRVEVWLLPAKAETP